MEGEGQREGQGSAGWSTEAEAAAVTNTSRRAVSAAKTVVMSTEQHPGEVRGVSAAKTVATSTEQHPGEGCGLEEQRGE